MASSGSSAAAAISYLGYLVTEKPVRNNHLLWRTQVHSALKSAQVAQYLDSTTAIPPKTVAKADQQVPNPDYDAWVAKDQQILNCLLSQVVS